MPIMRPDRLLTEGYRPKIKCTSHLTIGLNPEQFAETLHDIVNVLRHHDFDAIAFRGLSGALFAPTVAMKMSRTLIAVRKKATIHSTRIVEGDYNARRYVILDDFVSSGDTVRHIVDEICDAIPDARCIGVCEYMYLHNNAAARQLRHIDSIFGVSNEWRVKPKLVFETMKTLDSLGFRTFNTEPVTL